MTKILVIDDETDVRMILRLELEAEGYDVVEASSAAQGLTLVHQEQPDVVLLDLRMPGLDGWDVLRILHERDELPGLPVVVLSAHASDDSVARALEIGAAAYVRKPFRFDELLPLLPAP